MANIKKNRFKKAYTTVSKMPYVPIGKSAVELSEAYGDMSLDEAIMLAVATKAAGGDLSAATFIRDTLGEKPSETKNTNTAEPIKISVTDV